MLDFLKIIERAELLEISFVAVPANPEAISMDWKTFEKCKNFWLLKDIETEPKDDDNTKELELSGKINKLELEIKELKDWFVELNSLIKNMSNDNDTTPNTDEEIKQANKKFYQNLVKWANEVLCQMKKG